MSEQLNFASNQTNVESLIQRVRYRNIDHFLYEEMTIKYNHQNITFDFGYHDGIRWVYLNRENVSIHLSLFENIEENERRIVAKVDDPDYASTVAQALYIIYKEKKQKDILRMVYELKGRISTNKISLVLKDEKNKDTILVFNIQKSKDNCRLLILPEEIRNPYDWTLTDIYLSHINYIYGNDCIVLDNSIYLGQDFRTIIKELK